MRSVGGWGFHRLEHPPKLHLRAQAPKLPLFVPQAAIIKPASNQYPTHSLLGLPSEIRYQIWDYVLDDIEFMRAAEWHSKPRTPYDALPLASRQIYHEMRDYISRSVITRNRLNIFFNQPYSESILHSFRSLTLEIPFNMGADFFSKMAQALGVISPVLEVMQLFFTGQDAYGTRVTIHGCGNRLQSAFSRDHKLPQDGQGFEIRYRVINALSTLTKLKALTLSNINIPLLQPHFMRDKPQLEKLCIVSDPRTSLWLPWKIRNSGDGLLLPVSQNFPPVKELYLSANAVVASIQVPSKLSGTLQKLTWVVPNVARQAGNMIRDWHDETSILLMNLRSNARDLHTLRICIEGSTYEGHATYGALIGSFKEHMPRIRSLKHLELHMWSKSPYIAKEFVSALPKSLERLYISDRFAPAAEICQYVGELYGIHHIGPYQRSDRPSVADELNRKDYIQVHNGKLAFLGYEYDGPFARWRIVEDSGDESATYRHDALLTEDELSLLWLNGRLLDRERHTNIAALTASSFLEPGAQTPPRVYPSAGAFYSTAAKNKDTLMMQVSNASIPSHGYCHDYEVPPPNLDDYRMAFTTSTTEYPVSRGFYSDTYPKEKPRYHFKTPFFDRYFGNETEAESVFQAERPMKAENLLPLKYPAVVPCPTGYEDYEHWMCP